MNRILIVDDSPTVSLAVKSFLVSQGFSVTTVSDGCSGLETAKKEKPDLILLDVMLPKLNGYEVCSLLKMDSSFSHIPIILFTAKMTGDARAMGNESGADAFLGKDTPPEILIKTIRDLLGNKSL